MSVLQSLSCLVLFTIVLSFVSGTFVHLPDSKDADGEPLLHDPSWPHWGFDPTDLPHIKSPEEHKVESEGQQEPATQSEGTGRRRAVTASWTRYR